jgi:1-acyl-sn-glycerol-3-phosphate acyltransferase
MAVLAGLVFCLYAPGGHSVQRLWAKGICLFFGIRTELFFAQPLPDGGAILAPNHQSVFDIFLLATLPIDFKWVAKEEIRRVPIVGAVFKFTGNFFLSRHNFSRDLNVLMEVEEALKKGTRVLIFPEGTRSRDGKLQELKKGAFRCAQNAGVPIYPIAIDKSYAIAPPRRLPQSWGHHVRIRTGAALYPEAGEDLAAFMERYRKDLVRLLEEASAS